MRAALALLAMLACPTAAQACEDLRPFVLEDIRSADAIFTGRLADYTRIDRDPPDAAGPYGLLTVDVEGVIKGQVPRRIQLAWHNSTFGISEERPTGVPLLVAAFQVDDDMPGPVWRVLQTTCAPPFLLDDTPRNRADVRAVLRGGSPPPADYFALQDAAWSRLRDEAREEAQEKRVFGPVALGGIAVVLAGLGLLARRKA